MEFATTVEKKEETKRNDKYDDVVSVLNKYYTQPNDKLWNDIENNNILAFKSTLTTNNQAFPIKLIIKRIIQSHMKFEINAPAFLQFIIKKRW